MPVQNEGEPFQRIDVNEAKAMIDAGGVQVIDSREPHEHHDGHHNPKYNGNSFHGDPHLLSVRTGVPGAHSSSLLSPPQGSGG